MIRYFGIRHHGPASALRLKTALEEWKPDLILIELPADAQSLLDSFDPGFLTPPVSILIYAPKAFEQAAYFPLAEFSPEWQALQYGFDHLVPCKAIDLPMSRHFQQTLTPGTGIQNPFEILAAHTGFADVEQWWDHYLENNQSSSDLFQAIEELMDALREDLVVSDEVEKREQYMHSEINRFAVQGFERVAVVCGAFHVPALKQKTTSRPAARKKTKSTGTEAIWIPWSYERLTRENGYGAGVRYPTWYEALYHHGPEAAALWIARAVHVIRKKGKNISSAHSLEALRLADAMRRLRQKNRIGIIELEDALTAVFFEGETDWKHMYGSALFTGEQIGQIGRKELQLPIQQDFRSQIRKARIGKILEERKEILKTIDLRKDLHLAYSRFFNQTRVLDIPLAVLQEEGRAALGTFRETWEIDWDPVAEWTVVQAGTYGTTIETASLAKLVREIADAGELEVLVRALEDCFLCGFEDLFKQISEQIYRMYAVSESVLSLIQCLEMLIYVDLYGHIRWEKTPDLLPLIERITDRLSGMIPPAILQMDEDTDRQMRQHLNQVQYALTNPAYRTIREIFSDTWLQILHQNNLTDYYHGLALRQVMDLDLVGPGYMEQQMNRHFSEVLPENILDWLEGLLSGNILWITYDRNFLGHLNTWIKTMADDTFMDHLPVLRKIFTRSGEAERRKLMEVIRFPGKMEADLEGDKTPEVVTGYIDDLVAQYN